MNLFDVFRDVLTLTIPNVCVDFGYWLLITLGVIHTTRWLDRRSGVQWKEVYAVIKTDPKAVAIYAGCRLLALFLLGAAVALRG